MPSAYGGFLGNRVAEELSTLIEASVDVRLADLDQLLGIARLEHQQGEEVGHVRLLRSEGPGEELHADRQVLLVLPGQLAKVDGGAKHQQVDGLESVAVLH